MQFFQKLERNDILLKKIGSGNTGTPEECARRLGICKSTLAYYIEYWRSLGTKIIYNYRFKTYEFVPGFEAQLMYCLRFIENGEAIIIFGNYDGIRHGLNLKTIKSKQAFQK